MMSGQFWAIGECMLELRPAAQDQLGTAVAGDTYNTAVYLKRLCPALAVRYVSALGDDTVSARLRQQLHQHAIDDALVDTLPGQLPGLYLIEIDAAGERRFLYWRSQSAARSMLGDAHFHTLQAALPACGMLMLSGISLAILDEARRERLLALARAVRQRGGKVVLDSNYRPALWPADEARHWLDRALALTTHALLGQDDEQLLHGEADPAAVIARACAAGVGEVVVKRGVDGAVVCLAGGTAQAVPVQAVTPVDTTAAGDSFNAAYLAARLTGSAPTEAAALGHRLASLVILHPGAIVPPEAMPPVEQLFTSYPSPCRQALA